MKYFTPERFVRLQEASDREAVMLEWETAADEYTVHLHSLAPQLSRGMAKFIQAGSLHDATVLAMWTERDQELHIILRQEHDHVIDLAYRLTEPPRIDPAALPESHRTVAVNWLYDELAIIPSKARRNGAAKATVFRHDILLSNGCEVSLRFQRLTMHRHPMVEAVAGVAASS